MAALDVVHRNLKDAGLGSFCLCLHSRSARKQEVMESLRERLIAAPPAIPDFAAERIQWANLVTRLNKHPSLLRNPAGWQNEEVRKILGRVVNLRAKGTPSMRHYFQPPDHDEEAYRHAKDCLDAVAAQLQAHPWLRSHVWAGFDASSLRAGDEFAVESHLREIHTYLDEAIKEEHRFRLEAGDAARLPPSVVLAWRTELPSVLRAFPDTGLPEVLRNSFEKKA